MSIGCYDFYTYGQYPGLPLDFPYKNGVPLPCASALPVINTDSHEWSVNSIREDWTMKKTRMLLIVGMLGMLMLTGTAWATTTLYPGAPSGNGITPVLVYGNPTCADVPGCGGSELKVESTSYSGRWYTDDSHTSWVDITQSPGNIIAWTSNFDVNCVLMKGSHGADDFCYPGGSRGDTLLHPPINPSEGYAGISHINFCYDTPRTPVPEFPSWYLSVAGIAGLAAALIGFRRK